MNNLPLILHVEDAPEQLQLVRLLLGPVCTLHQASSLNEANLLIKNNIFDLVLLDMQLSDGRGHELIPLIKQRAASTRIVLHTADEQPAIETPVDGIISKIDVPITNLREKVLAILQT